MLYMNIKRICYMYDTERMEQHEEASEGVFAQEIVVPLTERLQQDVKQVLSAVTEHHMESENKSISGDARAKRLNGFLMTC